MRQEKLGCMGDFANGRPGVASKLFFAVLFLGPWNVLRGKLPLGRRSVEHAATLNH